MAAYAIPGDDDAAAVAADAHPAITARASISTGIGTASGLRGESPPRDLARTVFRELDPIRTGAVHLHDFRAALRASGAILSDDSAQAITGTSDPAAPVDYRTTLRHAYDLPLAERAAAATRRQRYDLGPSTLVGANTIGARTAWATNPDSFLSVPTIDPHHRFEAYGTADQRPESADPDSKPTPAAVLWAPPLHSVPFLMPNTRRAPGAFDPHVIQGAAAAAAAATTIGGDQQAQPSHTPTDDGAAAKAAASAIREVATAFGGAGSPTAGRAVVVPRPGAALRRFVSHLDGDRDRRVTHAQLAHGLSRAGVTLGPERMRALLRAFDPRGEGTVDLDAIAAAVDDDAAASASASASASATATASAAPASSMTTAIAQARARGVLQRLRRDLHRAVGSRGLAALLRPLDSRHAGHVDARAAAATLAAVGVTISAQDLASTLSALTSSSGAGIDYIALDNALRLGPDLEDSPAPTAQHTVAMGVSLSEPLDSVARRDDLVTARVLRHVATRIGDSTERLRSLVGAASPDETLSAQRIRQALRTGGLPLSEEDYGRLLAVVDPRDSGQVAFRDLCAALGVSPPREAPSVRTRATDALHVSLDGGIFHAEPPERKAIGSPTFHHTYQAEPRPQRRRPVVALAADVFGTDPAAAAASAVAAATSTGEGLTTVPGSTMPEPSPHARPSPRLAVTLAGESLAGVANPNRLTDPAYNPREALPAATEAAIAAARQAAPLSLARQRYTDMMRQHYPYAGGAAAEGNASAAQIQTEAERAEHILRSAGLPSSALVDPAGDASTNDPPTRVAERIALAEQIAEHASRGLRRRHIVARVVLPRAADPPDGPADMIAARRNAAHTRIFDAGLPFAQAGAELSGRDLRPIVRERARSAQRERVLERATALGAGDLVRAQDEARQRAAQSASKPFLILRPCAAPPLPPRSSSALRS